MTHVLSRLRIVPALVAGALVGAAVVALWTNLPLMARGDPHLWTWLRATFLAALLVWVFGLTTVGGLIWRASESAGRRSPAHAVLMGMISTGVGTMLLTVLLSGGVMTSVVDGRALVLDGQRTPYGWWLIVRDGWLMSLLGGLVGGVVWRIAYRRSAAS